MMRHWLLVFIMVVLCGCGREAIDAADRAVGEAVGVLGQHVTEQLAIARSFVAIACAEPAEKENCRQLREAIRTGQENDLAQADLTDTATVDKVRRSIRSLDQQLDRMEPYAKKYPQPAAAGELPVQIERWKLLKQEIQSAMERYDQAARGYNRALRTFPESITNNMFLRLKSRIYLNNDQRSRNAAAPRR